MSARILITGGAGFLGKQFAHVIAKASGTPVLLDIKYNKARLICKNIKKNRIIIVSAIDNLIKGASGQAVQNMNAAYQLKETMGLQ